MASDIIHKLVGLVNKPLINEPVQTSFIESCLLYIQKYLKNPKFIMSCIAVSTAFYIINPLSSVFLLIESNKKQIPISRRPDKYTTGFINTGNDCFANSTIQSFVPLYKLREYFQKLFQYKLPPEAIRYPLPLHLAIFELLKKLQNPINSNFSLSVWDLLHLLESIHHGKISRSQHDAHELFLMLIDTLYEEYNNFFLFFSKLSDDRKKEVEQIPKFPFCATVETKLKCMNCKCFSMPMKIPMMIIELTVPQNTNFVTLENLLKNSNNEVIEGYSCFICMIKNIIFQLSNLKLTSEQVEFIDKVKSKLIGGELFINDDLRENSIYKAILLQNRTKLSSSTSKSVIHKETRLFEPPQELSIHLSRSIYMDTQIMKSSCNVKYNTMLELRLSNGLIVTYKLRSLIRHRGTHSSGHYECYRIKPNFVKLSNGEYENDIPKLNQSGFINGKRKKLASILNKPFWRISDNKITEVTTNDVLNDGKAAYMLIYEQI